MGALVPGNVAHAQRQIMVLRDNRRTTIMMMSMFAGVTAVDGWLWIAEGSVPFLFGAGVGVAGFLLGMILHIRHGIRMRQHQNFLRWWNQQQLTLRILNRDILLPGTGQDS